MARTLPRLAVVTPTFNRHALVERLHKSLLSQAATLDWVHIVVDDGSESDLALSRFRNSDQVRFVRNNLNRGPLVCRNIAVDIAVREKADLIAFIDDDDYVTDAFFSYVLRIWKEQPEVGWYITRCAYVGQYAPKQQRWPVHDGLYGYARDMQLNPKFTSDVTHVVSIARLGSRRFSRFGVYQREWTLLSKLARDGDFYASHDCFTVREYLETGLTNTKRGRAPDLISVVNYVQKPFTIVTLAPRSIVAWRRFVRQLLAFPIRLLILAVSKNRFTKA
jgi:glycosyltransferase involved in cell wall biosynthesis